MDTPTEEAPIKLTLNTAVEISKNNRYFAQYNKLRELDGVNKLQFPNFGHISPREYDFNPGDFEPINSIVVSDRVIVEQYLYKPTNVMMAVKLVRVSFYENELDFKEKILHKWKEEIETCKELPLSPNLVKIYGFCVYGGYVLVCMEYMDISLSAYINKLRMRGLKPSNVSVGRIGVSIINAMNDLKQKKIIHRDIKPQNIVMNKNGEVKLCDFGVSRIMEDSLATTATGTIPYWPPERFQLDSSGQPIKYNTKADVWSLGMTLGEIWNIYRPFIDIESKEFASMQNYIINMSKNKVKNQLQQNTALSLIIEDFILECLKNVEERPTVEKLMDTEFYQRYKTVPIKDIQVSLDSYKIWNEDFDVFKNKNHAFDKELLQYLMTKNEKEFLLRYDISSQSIIDLLTFFKEILREYKPLINLKRNEDEVLREQFINSVRMISLLYFYSYNTGKNLKFVVEICELLAHFIVDDQIYDPNINITIIYTLDNICSHANAQELAIIAKTRVVEKIIFLISNENIVTFKKSMILSSEDCYVLNSVWSILLCFIRHNVLVEFFTENKRIEFVFSMFQYSILHSRDSKFIDCLNALLLRRPEKLLPYIEQNFETIISYFQGHIDVNSAIVACNLITGFLITCDKLHFETTLDLDKINRILLENICSWKITEFIYFNFSYAFNLLHHALKFHLKSVQLFNLWYIANKIIVPSIFQDQIKYQNSLIQDLIEKGAIKILQSLIKNQRISKRAKALAELILMRLEAFQNDKNIEEVVKKAEEINTCDVEDAYTLANVSNNPRNGS